MQTFDFSRSFLTFRVDLETQPAVTLSHVPPTTVNNARIQIECICTLTHQETTKSTQYVLIASCKTERVGAERDLWLEPNGDFCLVASSEDFMIIKSWQQRDMKIQRHPASLGYQKERQTGKVSEAWTSFRIAPVSVQGRPLETTEDIIDAPFRDAVLTARTAYSEGGYDVCIDYPVKTFNVSEKEMVYQTDTGPVIVPDLSPARRAASNSLVECFDLAYSAFNCPDWSEFVINVPTPLTQEISVDHYAKPRRIEGARNTLVEIA
jgi:hypothetical protein